MFSDKLSGKRSEIGYEEAEQIAIEGLQFVASDMELLGRFLAATGLGPETLRDAAADPTFLAGILEFLMSDESVLLSFLETRRIRPTMIAAARYRLSGDSGLDD